MLNNYRKEATLFMERIIHLTKAFLEKIFTEHAYNVTDLDSTASALKKDSDQLSREILQVLIEEMNTSLRKDKSKRKELGLVIKEKDRPRNLLTELGEIKFSRDYYYNKNTEEYETPLDAMMSIERRARIGGAVSAKLSTKATVESYERTTQDVTGGLVSRQTVLNHIHKTPELEKEPKDSEKRKVEILDVYADEDHVHLQKPGKEKGKKSKVVPLVTVTEGKVKVGKTRYATVNPMHFVDEKQDTDALWESVEGYIMKTYDMEHLKEIRLHGDGAKWINKGLGNFPNVVRVLDGFHLQEYLKGISRKFPKQHVQRRINEALAEDNRDKVEAILRSLISLCKDEKEFEKIQDVQTYLFSNWEAAVNRFKEGISGSCTEGLISHVLSERFSRNPMGWSEKGVGKLSKLRVFCKNGGKIEAKHFRQSHSGSESYREYASRCVSDFVKGCDLSWINDMRDSYVFDTTSGTQQLIKKIGRCRSDIFC